MATCYVLDFCFYYYKIKILDIMLDIEFLDFGSQGFRSALQHVHAPDTATLKLR